MKRMNKGLSIFMSFLLCIQGLNFSVSANAEEPKAARIIEFNSLDEKIAFQTLPIGAGIDDVVFPDSIKAKVETTEKESANKAVEKETSKEPLEKVEQTEKTENNAEKTETEKKEQSVEAGEKVEKTEKKEQAEETEKKTEETENNDQVEETEKETETAEDETGDPEIATETETVAEPDEPEQVEESKPAEEEASESGTVDIGFLDIIFPAIIARAAEDDESISAPTSSEADITPVLSEEKQETETNTATEITIENVTWQEADGKQFDSSNEASFTFEPVFTTDYAVDAALPTITVNIVKTDISTAFEKTAVVDGVCVSVIADPGVFPDDATLSVERVVGANLQAVEKAVDKERADDKNKAESYTFEIKVIDKDGNEIEPDISKGQVKVSFTLEEVANVNLETDVYHVKGEVGDLSVDKLETTETAETTVEAVTDGFSFYTVEFTYGNLQYVLKGDSSVALSDILQDVGLSGEVTNASVSNEELISVSNETGEWIVKANKAFSTEEWLKVTLDGVEFKIVVTDSEYVASVTVDETTTNYATISEALDNWSDGSTLKLLSSVNYNARKTLVGGSRTLDLNGKEWTGNQSDVSIQITINATLTLQDSSGTNAGKITGNGSNDWHGVIWVEQGSTFNMHGGTISGNTGACGVWIDGRNRPDANNAPGAIFNMYGGVITGNKRGVYVGSQPGDNAGEGYFNIYGGTITENNCDVYVKLGKVNIASTLSNTNPIKVDMQTPGVFTNSTDTSYNDASKFTSDNASYVVSKNADGQLELGYPPVASVTVGDTTTNYTDFATAVSAWNSAESGSTLTLLDDVTTASTISISGTKILDLNGYGIRMTGSGSVIFVGTGASLDLYDNGTTVRYYNTSTSGPATLSDTATAQSFTGGYITGGEGTYESSSNRYVGGGVYVKGGSFTMYGGTIFGNGKPDSNYTGGGMQLTGDGSSTGTFTMNGGAFIGNAGQFGGGIEIIGVKDFGYGPAECTINGGEFKHNACKTSGSAIRVTSDTYTTVLNIYGGTISGNSGNGAVMVYLYGNTGEKAINLSGNPDISDNLNNNQPCNLRLHEGIVNIVGSLGNATNIGVTMQTPGVFTNSTDTSYNDASKFTSDKASYAVNKNADGQLELGTPTDYGLYVGNEHVTSAKTSGTGWSYDASTNTLTLNNYSFNGLGQGGQGDPTAIQYIPRDGTFNIVLNGTNTVTQNHKNNGTTWGIYCRADFTIGGDGILNVSTQDGATRAAAIYSEKNLTIKDSCTINAVSGTVTGNLQGYGIGGGAGKILTIGGNAKVTLTGPKGGTEMLVKNSVPGFGWTDTDGNNGKEIIEVSTSGQNLISYQKIQFPTTVVTVNYKIINGTWADDTTEDKTESIAIGLMPVSVPTGMKASKGYTGGVWDTNPAETTITGAATFTYSFEEKPAATVKKAPTAKTLTYTGSAQELVAAGETEGGTMYYALGENATTAPADNLYTTSIPTGTDAGTYYVWYMVYGDINHNNSAPACVSVTISKAEVTAPTIASKTYNGQLQTATVAASTLYSVTTNEGGTNAGNYDVVLTLSDAANYKWTDSEEADRTLTFTITQAGAPDLITPTPDAVTYDPAKTLESVALPDGWSWVTKTTVPTVSNNGYEAEYSVPDYTNYDYSNVDGYSAQTHRVTRTVALTVNKSEVTTPTIASKTYNGQLQTATVAASTLYSVTTNEGGTNAGNYDVVLTLSDAANYKWTDSEEADKSLTFTITQATAPAIVTPTPDAVTYDPAKTLESVALPDGWSWVTKTTVPTVSNNGYEAEYSVPDYTNYDYSNVDGYSAQTHKVTRTVALTVNKAESKPATVTANNRTYDRTEKPLVTVDGESAGGTMKYALGTSTEATEEYTTSIPTATDAKTYYVWYKVMGDSNHNDSDPMCVVVTIDYVTVAVTFDANGGMGTIEDQILIYNVEQALTANAFTRDDYSFSGWNTKSDGTGTPYSDEAGVALTDNLTLYAQWSAKPLYRISGTVKQGGNAISGVTIRLVKGSKKIAVTSTNASGEFSFSAPEDVYNIIAEKDGKTNTTLVTLNQEQTIEIIMPSANVNSLLVLNNGNTPNVMVGGLDELAETYRENGKTVTVTMTVEEKSGDQATGSAEIENVADGMKLEYLDIYLTKTLDSTESQVTEANSVLEIVVPYDFSKKKQTIVKVYRYHDSSAMELAENDTKADGTYRLDKENNLVYIYANLFSTYAIGFIPTYKVSGNISFGSYTGEVSFSLTGNDITKTETSSVTNGSGSYSFTGLPAGTYNVTASWNEGGKAQSLTFTVTVPT